MTTMPPWSRLHTAATRRLAGFHRIPPSVRDELAQEALVRTLAADEVHAPAALVKRIARNLAIDWLRRRREEHWPEGDIGCDRWQQSMNARLDARRVLTVLNDAPRSYRDVVRRCFLEDEDVDVLIEEERQPGEERGRVQDRIYKRRARGVAWARARMQAS